MEKKYKYDVRFLVDDALKEKVEKMRDDGINVSQILRNFLKEYQYKQS